MKATVIYGAPGTGKTTYLTTLCGGIFERKPNAHVLYLSFTKSASKEAEARFKSLAKGGWRRVNPTTIHSLAFRALKIDREQIIDSEKIKLFEKEIGVEITKKTNSDENTFLSIIQRAASRMISPKEAFLKYSRNGDLNLFLQIYNRYESWKSNNEFYDFNDMLQIFIKRDVPFLNALTDIIIDEAQDLTPLQWAVIDKIIKKIDHVYIAGDDDQAIYTWAGAEPDAMRKFEKHYSAERIVLNQSYRLPECIKNLSDKLIGRIPKRVHKEYVSKDQDLTLQRIFSHENLSNLTFDKQDTLILFRENLSKKLFERKLIETGTPYISEDETPTWYNDKYAIAIRAYDAIANRIKPSDQEMTAYEKIRQNRPFADTWQATFQMKPDRELYYTGLNLYQVPNIRLSTIHRSKGREADRVILYTGTSKRSASNLFIDHDSEVRTFFVGVTRAKEQLDIVNGKNNFNVFQ